MSALREEPGAGPALPARPERANRLARVKKVVVGEPLPTENLIHERLGKPTALAVFASDNLSSSAYATEEILRVLLLGAGTAGIGAAAFARVVPITVALLGVLAILLFSYRQTIKAYPQAGGAYLVTRDNFGLLPAQVAGVALLTDYILTVSVSVSAGTAALTSIAGGLYPYRVIISVAFIVILAMGNLRGVRESGRIFATPTFFFIAMMAVLLCVGFYRMIAGTLPSHASQFPLPDVKPLAGFALVFLVVRAFASGGAAVTGVEAISNGVPAFRPPEWLNARTTLMWMGSILGVLFLGLSIFAAHMHIAVDESEKVTVIAQIGKGVFGRGGVGTTLFWMLQIATMLILVLAANTSFADFPRLASFHAGDKFLPRQLTRHGDRLVFSNGIMALSAFAVLLVIVFKASVTALIPLYAIGVFTSFTFSQLGMAKRHRTIKEPGWKAGLVINGVGGIVSGLMTVILAIVKFHDGAWIILVAVPTMLFGLLRVNKHYEAAGRSLREPGRRGPLRDSPRQMVIIPVGVPGPEDVYAAAYAKRVFPLEVRLVHFGKPGTSLEFLVESWGHIAESVELRRTSGNVADDIVDYVRAIRAEVGDDRVINVLIPEKISGKSFRHFMHKWHVQRIKAALVAEAGVVITNVVHHPGYEELEPIAHPNGALRAMEGWRHVAIVLVSAVHNATARSLRYARSLRPDDLRCIHVGVDEHEAEVVAREWVELNLGEPLEVIPSPLRQISDPLHAFVREILEERPKTFVTIVIPEFVVQKRWHHLMHNQTALTLKATFLFEPSVVVSAVPYRL
ncbi:MAG: APC family permease [Actinomycetota bacterium]